MRQDPDHLTVFVVGGSGKDSAAGFLDAGGEPFVGFAARVAECDGPISDGRRSLLVLTRSGAGVLSRIRTTRTAAVTAAVASWSATDRAALARLLPRLVAGMRDQSGSDGSPDHS